MAEENIYDTFSKTLYRINTAVYQTDVLSDVNAVLAISTPDVSPVVDPGGTVSVPTTTVNEMVQGSYQSGDFLTGVRGWIIRANGDVEFGSGYFRGDITGASGTFSGTITATTGAIGGFNLGADYLKDTADSFGMASTVTGGNDVRLWAGATFANRATAPFRVYEDGSIGGSALTVSTIDIGGDDATSAHIDSSGNLWLGASVANKAIAPARISNGGVAHFSSISLDTDVVLSGLQAGSSLAIQFLTAGSITSKAITLAVADGTGDTYIAAGKTDFDNTVSGFILGVDDSDANKAKFFIGDANQYLNWDGSNLYVKGTFSDTQTFTSSGTWTKPTGLTGNETVIVKLWGAGGAGGGVNATPNGGGGGGGGGSFIQATFLASDLTSPITVTIGTGGTGVSSNNGNVGNNSTFGTYLIAYGGGGGGTGGNSTYGGGGGGGGISAVGASAANTTSGAGGAILGGAATGAASNFGGGGGGTTTGGVSVYGGGGGGKNQGAGGNSVYGGGGGTCSPTTSGGGTSVYGGVGGNGRATSGIGNAGTAPGGGGGGAYEADANAYAGGAGGDGKCIVWIIR